MDASGSGDENNNVNPSVSLGHRRLLLRRHSSIAARVHVANTSVGDNSLWGVAAVVVLVLACTHGLSYVIVEYGFFGGNSEYSTLSKCLTESYTSTLPDPSDNELSMTDSAPTAELDACQFMVYIGFVMYATVVLTGLGMEYLVWRMLLNGGWDEDTENKWKVAQFVFPILVATSVGLATTGNYLCLPIMAVSMFKMGFPETILFLYSALYEKEHGFVKRLVDFVRGMGNIIHHSSSALYIAMIVTHVLTPTPDVLSVLPPLLMQHWFVLLKYNYKWLYIILATSLEVWFEWTSFSSLEKVHQIHWVGGVLVLSMVFAHWCYFGAGLISLVFLREKEELTSHEKVLKLNQMKSVRFTYDPDELSLSSEEMEKGCGQVTNTNRDAVNTSDRSKAITLKSARSEAEAEAQFLKFLETPNDKPCLK